MLKIKDSVDLEVLKKFGFELIGKSAECYKVYIQNPQYNSPACLIVSPVSRKIVIDTNSTFIRDKLDILYDLIKDDLVEKVKEKD